MSGTFWTICVMHFCYFHYQLHQRLSFPICSIKLKNIKYYSHFFQYFIFVDLFTYAQYFLWCFTCKGLFWKSNVWILFLSALLLTFTCLLLLNRFAIFIIFYSYLTNFHASIAGYKCQELLFLRLYILFQLYLLLSHFQT